MHDYKVEWRFEKALIVLKQMAPILFGPFEFGDVSFNSKNQQSVVEATA